MRSIVLRINFSAFVNSRRVVTHTHTLGINQLMATAKIWRGNLHSPRTCNTTIRDNVCTRLAVALATVATVSVLLYYYGKLSLNLF